jgi:hypothetical protein
VRSEEQSFIFESEAGRPTSNMAGRLCLIVGHVRGSGCIEPVQKLSTLVVGFYAGSRRRVMSQNERLERPTGKISGIVSEWNRLTEVEKKLALPHLLIRVESWHKWRRLEYYGIFKWIEWLFEDAGVDF